MTTPSHEEYFRRGGEVARVDMDKIDGDEPRPPRPPMPQEPPLPELRDTIRENAAGPKRVQGDAGSVEQHSLRDQIEAERFLAAKEATRRGLGIRLVKLKPGGTT
jgi:hypothetical protein